MWQVCKRCHRPQGGGARTTVGMGAPDGVAILSTKDLIRVNSGQLATKKKQSGAMENPPGTRLTTPPCNQKQTVGWILSTSRSRRGEAPRGIPGSSTCNGTEFGEVLPRPNFPFKEFPRGIPLRFSPAMPLPASATCLCPPLPPRPHLKLPRPNVPFQHSEGGSTHWAEIPSPEFVNSPLE